MSKKNKIQVFLIMAAILAVLFCSCLFILIRSTEQRFADTAQITASRICELIQSNADEKTGLQDSLKE